MYQSDLKHINKALKDKLQRLYRLNRNVKIDLGFRPPYLELLAALGNPHLKLPPIVHVAGTNGKGSTIAIMRAVLEAAGYTVHVYTSPHLQRFNERIVLAGAMIGDEELEALIDEVLTLNREQEVTFFEATTAMAFAAFVRHPADVLLLETGLGGRLDCTNIIEKPLVTVISSIGYDHMEFLGGTLAEIAAEKAGIMKGFTGCVIGSQEKSSQNEEVINVLNQCAGKYRSVLYRYGVEWCNGSGSEGMFFEFAGERIVLPLPALPGPHQVDNAGAALAALKVMEQDGAFKIPVQAMARGLKNVSWPARLQKLADPDLKQGWELWLDGGHNEDAGTALAAQAEIWRRQDGLKLHLILGMMGHKNPRDFLTPLLPYLDSVTLVDIPGEPGSMKAAGLLQNLDGVSSVDIAQADNVQITVSNISSKKPTGRILIAGSLYLAGHVLDIFTGRTAP